MLVVAALVESRRRGLRPLVVGVPVFLAIASPILAWRLRHAPASLHWFSADREWITGLRDRSSHHMFPLSWGWAAWPTCSWSLLSSPSPGSTGIGSVTIAIG